MVMGFLRHGFLSGYGTHGFLLPRAELSHRLSRELPCRLMLARQREEHVFGAWIPDCHLSILFVKSVWRRLTETPAQSSNSDILMGCPVATDFHTASPVATARAPDRAVA